jgi:hypothetical protein
MKISVPAAWGVPSNDRTVARLEMLSVSVPASPSRMEDASELPTTKMSDAVGS